MTKLKRYHLKNEMLIANMLANLIAVAFFQVLVFRAEPDLPEHIWQNPAVEIIDILFTPAAFIFVWVMTLRYERPIRKYLEARFAHKSVSQQLEETARRKVLNEPYVLIGLSLCMWILSAIVYCCMWWILKDIIRQHADQSAREIIQTVITAVDRFCDPLQRADDVTLVVTKIT